MLAEVPTEPLVSGLITCQNEDTMQICAMIVGRENIQVKYKTNAHHFLHHTSVKSLYTDLMWFSLRLYDSTVLAESIRMCRHTADGKDY